MRIGEYFVNQKYISQEQLEEALALQNQNRSLLLGQIFVTMGIIPMKDLYKYVKSYLESLARERETILEQDQVEEETRSWITQNELDQLLEEKSRGQW